MIEKNISEYGFDAASDPSVEVEIGHRMMHAAYMRLEGSENDVALHIYAGLTQGDGLYMGERILREAGKGVKLHRRMSSKE